MSNKRQWYAIRSDLQKRGLWKYSGAKRAKTAGQKRKAPEPEPAATQEEDPLEGPSTKYPSLGEVVQTTVSALAGPSAGALRVISTGAQVWGTLTGQSSLIAAGSAGNFVASFLDAAAGGAGATTSDSAATAAGQRSNAPNQEDITSAPAPQLAETTDPIGNTRPEVPETEFDVGVESRLYDPLNSPEEFLRVVITEIGGQDVEMMSDWDPEEVEQMLTDLENQILNVRKFLVGGSHQNPPIRVKQQSKHLLLNKFVPV